MVNDISDYPEIYKFLTNPEAEQLAELYLLQADLEMAHETLALYVSKYLAQDQHKDGERAIISSSLCRDGILLYCSCFSTKDPIKLNPEAVYGHLEGWEKLYQKLLDTRDSFVAHNFGPQRQHKVVVIALEIGGELVPAGLTQVYVRFGGWIAEEGRKILSFIAIAREHLERLIEEAEKPILKMLQGMTSDQLRALEDAELKVPETTDIRTSRSKFRESGRGEPVPLPSRRWAQRVAAESENPDLVQLREDPDEEAPSSEEK